MKQQKQRVKPKISQITENLYLGDNHDSKNKELLKELKITHILICCETLKARYPNDFSYLHLPITRGNWDYNISKHFEEACEFIKEGKCLVHCIHGKHRSPSFVIASLIKDQNMSFEQAFDHVKSIRPTIAPTKTFCGLLKNFDKQVKYNSQYQERMKKAQEKQQQKQKLKQQEQEEEKEEDEINLKKKPVVIKKYFQAHKNQTQQNNQEQEESEKENISKIQNKPKYQEKTENLKKKTELPLQNKFKSQKKSNQQNFDIGNDENMEDMIQKQLAIEQDLKQKQQYQKQKKVFDQEKELSIQQQYDLGSNQEENDLKLAMELYNQEISGLEKRNSQKTENYVEYKKESKTFVFSGKSDFPVLDSQNWDQDFNEVQKSKQKQKQKQEQQFVKPQKKKEVCISNEDDFPSL